MKRYHAAEIPFLLLLLVAPVNAGSEWAVLGQSLCRGDSFGEDLALTELDNGFVLAVGSPLHTQDHYNQGRVDFLALNTGACLWETFANSIVGQRTQDQFGRHISLSCNALHVAVAGDLPSPRAVDQSVAGDLPSIQAVDQSDRFGYVQVYQRSGSGWAQMGETVRDTSRFHAVPTNFGFDVQLSCDGTMLNIASSEGHFIYIYKDNKWGLSRFLEGSGFVSAMARGVPVVALTDEGGTSVSVSALDMATGQWYQQGNNITGNAENATWSGSYFSIEDLDISNDGKRIVLGSPSDGVVTYDLTSDGQTWEEVKLVSSPDFYSGSSLMLSGDGSTVFRSRGYAAGLEAFRFVSYPAEDPNLPEELSLTDYGDTFGVVLAIDPSLGGTATARAAAVSKDGSVATSGSSLGSSGKVEVFFFPDSNATELKGLDCYPKQGTVETEECQAPPTETADVSAVQMTGNLEIDDGSASAAASVTFGVLVLCLAAALVGLFAWHIRQKRNERKSADENPEAEGDALKDKNNETEPLKDRPEELAAGEEPAADEEVGTARPSVPEENVDDASA